MNAADRYFMDDPRESARLAAKVDPAGWVARYLQDFSGGAVILDVGCGPGVILAEIRRRYSDLALYGVDLSESRLLDARRSLEDLRRVSVHRASATALPFKSDSFDPIYSRFLLEYLADRCRAVREMVRVCRPGGTVLLQDLDGQLVWHHPIDVAMQSQLSQVMTYLAPTGFDPFVGRKLFQLAREADLEHLTVEVEPYHLIAGESSPREVVRWRFEARDREADYCAGAWGTVGKRGHREIYRLSAETRHAKLLDHVHGQGKKEVLGESGRRKADE